MGSDPTVIVNHPIRSEFFLLLVDKIWKKGAGYSEKVFKNCDFERLGNTDSF
jgi:hypothetical protein